MNLATPESSSVLVNPGRGPGRWNTLMALLGPLLLGAILLYAFAPALTQCYGYNDDYHLLFRKLHGTFGALNNEFTQQGRPLGGLIWITSIPFPGSIEQLAGVRALALLGVWLLGWLQFRHLRKTLELPCPLSLGLVLGMLLTPAFAILVGWAELWSYPYACIAAYGAGLLAWRSGESSTEAAPPPGQRRGIPAWLWTGSSPRRRSLGREAAIGALLTLSLSTYQPTAPYFFVPVVAGVLAAPRFSAESERTANNLLLKRIIRCALVFLAWAVSYFVAYKSLLALLAAAKNGSTARAELVHDLGGKLLYLFKPVLWCGLTSWTRMDAPVWQWSAAAFTIIGAAGAVLFAPRAGQARGPRWDWAAAGALVIALGAAAGPLLVVKENTVAFRTLPAAFAVLMLAALLGWCGIVGWLAHSRTARSVLQVCALAGPVLFSAGSARHHLLRGLAKPNRKELEVLRTELRQRFTTVPERLIYLLPAPYLWNDPGARPFAEFGARSSAMPWVTSALFHLAFDEDFGRAADPAWPEICAAPTPATSAAPVIDGLALLDGTEHVRIQSLPRLGEVRMLPNGWCSSPWLGSFDAASYPYIGHPVLGWLYCDQKPSPDVYLYSNQFGWLISSPEKFPTFWLMQPFNWARLSLRLPPDEPWRDVQTGKVFGTK